MFHPKFYFEDLLQADPQKDILYRLGAVQTAGCEDRDAVFTLPLVSQARRTPDSFDGFEDAASERAACVRVRFYNAPIVRFQVSLQAKAFDDQSPMLAWHNSLEKTPCRQDGQGKSLTFSSDNGERVSVGLEGHFAPWVALGGGAELSFLTEEPLDALPFVALVRQNAQMTLGFALALDPNEHFCGTGERFLPVDLRGRQFDLVNEDAHGVTTSRAYKNVPFVLSSRGYGLFVHSTARMRLDLGCHAVPALQWFVQDDALDLFLIGGDGLPEILYNYGRITGFPAMPPVWSFGAWMGRFNYWTADEIEGVAQRLRDEAYPMDVINEDTTWFEENWKCDWAFSKERFPDPKGFFRRLRENGFRVCLWQWPYIQADTDLAPLAREKGYVGKADDPATQRLPGVEGLGVSGLEAVDTLDFSNPEAVAWYKGMLKDVLELGAAAFKTDFGEWVNEHAVYQGADAARYRNLFALLYHKAVWEAVDEATGEGIIWARAGWAGCQRYPVHWGGDCPATYAGLAGSLYGGLHLGLSGFAFWSHDAGGFFGMPDVLESRPTDQLYLRWTQFGVFSSHLRFHGTTPREPWEYPTVADTVRQWLRFRYALLPYILQEARVCCDRALPMLRSLVLDWPDDPAVWTASDEYLFGPSLLVCPIVTGALQRDVYLPEGKWVDFWSGETFDGPGLVRDVGLPVSRIPLYARGGAAIEFAEPVQCTDRLPEAKRFSIAFDTSYRGFDRSPLAQYVQL